MLATYQDGEQDLVTSAREGHSTVIMKKKFECYEYNPKPTQKTFIIPDKVCPHPNLSVSERCKNLCLFSALFHAAVLVSL